MRTSAPTIGLPASSVTLPVTVKPRSRTTLRDRLPTALDAELAARQRPANRHEARVIDLHVDFAHRDRHAVKVPLARGVGLQLRADAQLSRSPGRFLNSMLGPTFTPSTGFPSASTMIPPTDQAASSSAVKRGGIGSA